MRYVSYRGFRRTAIPSTKRRAASLPIRQELLLVLGHIAWLTLPHHIDV